MIKSTFFGFLLVLLIFAKVVYAQEPIRFPALTGDYAVSTTELHLIDTSRPETFTEADDDVRELPTTIYYPAQVIDSAVPAPYGNDALKDEASTWPGIGAASWSLIETGMVRQAPVAAGEPYPVIVFSPGLGTPPLYYTTLLAELASHGYVVISMARPYTTGLTVFPDGHLVRSNDAGTDVDGRGDDTYFDVLARRAAIGAVWAGDIRFVLDQLEVWNESDPLLAGHLDLVRIGVVGHSFGGSASAEAAYLDSRIGAVITMDSSLDGEVALEGLSQPYLYMEPANPPYEDPTQMPTDEQLSAMGITRDVLMGDVLVRINHILLLENSSAGYRLRLVGARHLTFTTDFHVFAPYFPGRINQGMTGTIDGERALQIITQYQVAFFDQHLKGQASPLLDDTASDDPDVVFEEF